MPYKFIHHKITLLSFKYAIVINLLFDILIYYYLISGGIHMAISVIIVKNIWFYLLPKMNSNKSFNYHIYNGLLILIKSIYSRDKIIFIIYTNMYLIMIMCIYYMLYLNDDLFKYIAIFLFFIKIVISYIFFNLSYGK